MIYILNEMCISRIQVMSEKLKIMIDLLTVDPQMKDGSAKEIDAS